MKNNNAERIIYGVLTITTYNKFQPSMQFYTAHKEPVPFEIAGEAFWLDRMIEARNALIKVGVFPNNSLVTNWVKVNEAEIGSEYHAVCKENYTPITLMMSATNGIEQLVITDANGEVQSMQLSRRVNWGKVSSWMNISRACDYLGISNPSNEFFEECRNSKWIPSSSKQPITPQSMEDSHLENTIRWCLTHKEQLFIRNKSLKDSLDYTIMKKSDYIEREATRTPIFVNLVAEALFRGLI